jgi:trimethylamine:corrinoid methyltransferase-like protein
MRVTNQLRGVLKPLSERQLDRIHTATLDVLENTGVRFTNAYVQSQWRQAGFPLDETGLVRLPPHVVEDAIRRTPRRYTRLGKTRNLDIHMGDGGLYVGVGSLPLYVVEWTGTEFIRRDATRQDMVRFAYLGDACPHLAIGNGQVKPKDVPDSVTYRPPRIPWPSCALLPAATRPSARPSPGPLRSARIRPCRGVTRRWGWWKWPKPGYHWRSCPCRFRAR